MELLPELGPKGEDQISLNPFLLSGQEIWKTQKNMENGVTITYASTFQK
jgi:hypothetical protein